GDGAVFNGSARARGAGMGLQRGSSGGRRDVRGQPCVGSPVGAAATRNRLDRTASANQVSVAGPGGPGGAAGGPDRRSSRRDVGGTAGGVAHDSGAEHAVAGNRSTGPHGQKKPYTPTNNAAPT